ncbi:hypothetical protein DFJ74DRAFT_363525 [Hyaloraphidium curvatum]|nr:hypothetical protein DFJ74DRAFT_363525 [Hyaloraphidium curvatum]
MAALPPPPPPPPPEAPPPLSARDAGLGNMAVLADELVSAVLARLSPRDLDTASACSRVLFLFARDDALWRAHCLSLKQPLVFGASWRETFVALATRPSSGGDEDAGWEPDSPERARRQTRRLDVSAWNVRSHHLHRKWQRSCMNIQQFDRLRIDCLPPLPTLDPVVDASAVARNIGASRPFLLPASATASWPAARGAWSVSRLLRDFPDVRFRTGAGNENNTSQALRYADMTLESYLDYCSRQNDESPLYIFDPRFAEKAPALLSDYEPPGVFGPDLLDAFPPAERPMDFRWLVIGPMRSGAGWHVDPLGTGAWNALIGGRKRWALYPPGHPPPGVGVFFEEGRIEAPSSLEWYLDVYPHLPPEALPIECVQMPGETIFVPAGWWHMILNLDEVNVAVTQNFLDERNVRTFAAEAAVRFPPERWSKISATMTSHRSYLAESFSAAARTFQPTDDPHVLAESHRTRASFMASFRSPEAQKARLDRLRELVPGLAGRWTPLGGSSPVFADASGRVAKLFPHLAAEGKGFGSEMLARERMRLGGRERLAPALVARGKLQDEGWLWPFMVMERAGGESLEAHRRVLLEKGLPPIADDALVRWIALTTRGLHSLPTAPMVESWEPRRHADWRGLFDRLFGDVWEARLARLPENLRPAVRALRRESSAEELLAGVPAGMRVSLLHCDLHAGNVFGEPSAEGFWEPRQVLDFGDAFHVLPGEDAWFDAAWDFVPVFGSVLFFDPERVDAFLEADGVAAADRPDVLRRVVLYSLVWEFDGAVEGIVAKLVGGSSEEGWDGDVLHAVYSSIFPGQP